MALEANVQHVYFQTRTLARVVRSLADELRKAATEADLPIARNGANLGDDEGPISTLQGVAQDAANNLEAVWYWLSRLEENGHEASRMAAIDWWRAGSGECDRVES